MVFIYLIVVFALGWLLLVRPQQQRARRQRDLIEALEVGNEVQTAGGILGRIVGLDDQVVRVEVAPGIVISFVRGAIARVVEVAEPGDASGSDGPGSEGPDAEGPGSEGPGGGVDPGGEPGRDQGPEAEAG